MAKSKPVFKIKSFGIYNQWNAKEKNLPEIQEFTTNIKAILASLGLKKNWKKKGHKNHPQKKVRARPFVLARWRQKKKVGVKQEEVSRLFLFWQINA